MHVAFEIIRPWPSFRRLSVDERSRRKSRGARRIQVRYDWASWWKPWAGWMQFWHIGDVEIYWPMAVTVWRRDRPGLNNGPHPKWRVTFPIVRDIRRRLLTRCEWCNGRSRKGDAVNHSSGSKRFPDHWWQGERGLYHGDCSSIAHSRTLCLCGDAGGPWESELAGFAYGRCGTCGLIRGWRSETERDGSDYPGLHSDRILASIPVGQRDPAKMAIVRELWAQYRA